MTRALAAIAYGAALVATIGAGLLNPWLMAVGGIGAALAAMVWGYYKHDPAERWRWNGERHDEPGYTGEVSHDGGKTWTDEADDLDRAAIWPREVGAPE